MYTYPAQSTMPFSDSCGDFHGFPQVRKKSQVSDDDLAYSSDDRAVTVRVIRFIAGVEESTGLGMVYCIVLAPRALKLQRSALLMDGPLSGRSLGSASHRARQHQQTW